MAKSLRATAEPSTALRTELPNSVDIEHVSLHMDRVRHYLTLFGDLANGNGSIHDKPLSLNVEAFSVVMHDLAERCGELTRSVDSIAMSVAQGRRP